MGNEYDVNVTGPSILIRHLDRSFAGNCCRKGSIKSAHGGTNVRSQVRVER